MRDKTAKFGIMAAVMVPALIFLASCEIPQSARIKASPTFQIPIPMGDGMDNSFIRPYISVEGIREQLKGQDEEGKMLSVYEYNSEELMKHFNITQLEGTNPVQTYLITYPLFDMSLDFNKYLKETSLDTDESRVPQIEITDQAAAAVKSALQLYSISPGADLPYGIWFDPFLNSPLKVDLGDMKDTVSDICFDEDVSFSIKAKDKATADTLEKAIRIRVPQLKIIGTSESGESSWVKGIQELNEKGEIILKFKNKTKIPANTPLLLNGTHDSDKIKIEIRLVNTINAGKYESELDFNWSSVKVKPKDESPREFRGFNLGSYLSDLGNGGVEFEEVPAYLYMDIPSSIGDFKVEINGITTVENSFPLTNTDIEDQISLPWLKGTPISYDFTGTLNNNNQTPIKYKITPPDNVTLHRSAIENGTDQKITANLAVLLPMVFKFTGATTQIDDDPATEEDESGNYYPIKFQGLDDFLGSGSSTSNTGVMEEIDKQLGEGGVNSLILRLRDIGNTVTSPIYLAIATDSTKETPGPGDWEIVKIASGAGKDIEIKNVASLSALPPIKFLIKEEGQGQGGMLYIQSQKTKKESAFSVKISVVADINLDKTL